MNYRKPITYPLPRKLYEVLEKSIGGTEFDIHDFHEILTALLWLRLIYKKDGYKYFALKNEYKTRNRSEIAHLTKFGIIKKPKSRNEFGHNIEAELIKGFVILEIPTNHKIAKRIIKKQIQNRHSMRDFTQLRKKIKNVNFDYNGAIKHLSEVIDEDSQWNAIAPLIALERVSYFKRSKVNGRLNTPFTNMRKDLRKFIIGMEEVDIKNSQPFLLAVILNWMVNKDSDLEWLMLKICSNKKNVSVYNHGVKRPETYTRQDFRGILKNVENGIICKNEAKYFLELCKEGVFYEAFGEKLGISRGEAKPLMFNVMFNKFPKSKGSKAFAKMFPELSKILKLMKKKSKSYLPNFLTRFEAFLFLDCIVPELLEVGIVPITVHDSCIVDIEDLKQTREIMDRVFLNTIYITPKY